MSALPFSTRCEWLFPEGLCSLNATRKDITEAFLTQFRNEFQIHVNWVSICKEFTLSDISRQEEAAKEYLAELNAHFPKLVKASRDVDAAASKLLLVIMGVA